MTPLAMAIETKINVTTSVSAWLKKLAKTKTSDRMAENI